MMPCGHSEKDANEWMIKRTYNTPRIYLSFQFLIGEYHSDCFFLLVYASFNCFAKGKAERNDTLHNYISIHPILLSYLLFRQQERQLKEPYKGRNRIDHLWMPSNILVWRLFMHTLPHFLRENNLKANQSHMMLQKSV